MEQTIEVNHKMFQEMKEDSFNLEEAVVKEIRDSCLEDEEVKIGLDPEINIKPVLDLNVRTLLI